MTADLTDDEQAFLDRASERLKSRARSPQGRPATTTERAALLAQIDQHPPPAAWLVVTDPDDTERRIRWPRAMALPRRGEHIRLDHDGHAEDLVVVDLVHLLHVETGSHMPTIHAVTTEETP